MKSMRILAALGAVCLGFAGPNLALAAGEWPLDSGDYVEVSMIKVDDGHALDYANQLAGQWRASQDYSKTQGWISKYEVWTNEYPRAGEADVYLITWLPRLPDAAESTKRDQAYLKYMKTTETQMQAASGKRAEWRHLAGMMLLRQQVWSK